MCEKFSPGPGPWGYLVHAPAARKGARDGYNIQPNLTYQLPHCFVMIFSTSKSKAIATVQTSCHGVHKTKVGAHAQWVKNKGTGRGIAGVCVFA